MVTGSRIEGGPQILTAGVRKTIQSIKEIVGNHSDAEIYVTLKETNMDPNETTQKLLNQDPFHEVKRKRDKKKEGTSSLVSVTAESRKNNENGSQVAKANNYSDRGVRRVGYARNALTDAGVSREFRVVRDNRSTQNANREVKPPIRSSSSTSEQPIANESGKSSSGAFIKEKASSGRHSSHSFTGQPNSHPKQDNNANVNSSDKGFMREITPSLTNSASKVNAVKPNDSRPHSTMSSNGSVIGVYSSSSDPVHVPSPVSRPAANVGAIKREVGVVGVRRSQNSAKPSSPNLHFGRARDNTPSGEPIQSLTLTPDSDHPSQSNGAESSSSNVPVNRSFVGNQYNNKPHQQTTGHQKALQPNKEWKPKTSQRSSDIHPGVIGTPPNSTPSLADNSEDLEIEDAQLQDKLSRVHFSENQNVIIAAHIRVSESDRCRLTFGSFGTEFDSSRNLGYGSVGVTEDPLAEPSASLSVSAPESSGDEISSNKPVDLSDDGGRNSRSNSPVPVEVSERQFTEEKGTSSPQKMDNYDEIGLVRDNSSTFTPLESQQRQDPPELPNFSEAYDPQAGYDLPYFRPAVDDTVRGQGLPSPQEAFGSYSVNNIPAVSSMAMVQQQPPLAQMFPQVHVSHFANLMPYRQFLSPVYVPPMAMPGYSSNPAYAHPPNGSSYLLMPGGGTHLTANGVKYGIQQLKPVPAGSPTGFGNFTNPSGFAINAPGVVGSAPGLEDSSRLKYKDGNHYVPNPQAETAEIWMNPRELSSMQSPSYYNMAGQPPPHAAAYMPSHTSHTSFNAGAAAAQSSHMQFPPGLYHHPPPPPQAGAIANPHHLGPPAAAPGAPVGAYQQSQLGHMNWTGNF